MTQNKSVEEAVEEFQKLSLTFVVGEGAVEHHAKLSNFFLNAITQAIQQERQTSQEREREIVEKFQNDFGDFAHEYYKGCEVDENDKWTYGYSTEVIYIVYDYFKKLTNPNKD